jgi:nucleotide-binding universal stress UspA family protein
VKLEHIVVATDASDVAGGAYAAALDLAARASARVTVMRTIGRWRVTVGAYVEGSAAELERLEEWVTSVAAPSGVPVKVGIEFGHPSVEIPRFAEANAADLLAIGRKPRTQAMRFRAGVTADAVVRRSRVPCLLVPPDSAPVRRVLAAVDGSLRGSKVFVVASEFARLIGAALRAVTVEAVAEAEMPDLARRAPRARTAQLRSEIGARLSVRHGSVFEQVLAEIRATGADLLAIGNQRGGPPGVVELGSVGRHLAHAAPCAVLTIPL